MGDVPPDPSSPRRLQQVRIAESVAAELRRRILVAEEGALLPKQDEIVAEFNVSYPSVREALRILETEGLITVRRGKIGGAHVHRPSAASASYAVGIALQASRVSLNDLAESLLVLEPLCAGMAASREDRLHAVIPLLRANLDESEAALDDGPTFTHAARQFHERLVASAGNHTLALVVHTLEALWTSQEEAWAASMTGRGDYFSTDERRAVLAAHRSITNRIERGDADATQRAARRHAAATQELFLSRFDNEVVDASSVRSPRF
jgi:DNA-binding FadR family transcriptional regulator